VNLTFWQFSGAFLQNRQRAEADGTIIASKTDAASCIGRLADVLVLSILAPGIDDKSFPDVMADDIVNCIIMSLSSSLS